MKTINTENLTKLNTITNSVNKHVDNILLLEKFISNPLDIANMLAKDESYNVTAIFQDVVKGLSGEFTNAKAIEIGRQTILDIIAGSAKTLNAEYYDIKHSVAEGMKTVNDKLEVIDTTCNLDSLTARRDAYMSTTALQEYVKGKIIHSLNSVITNTDVTDSIDANIFLNRLLRIILDNTKSNSFTDLTKYLSSIDKTQYEILEQALLSRNLTILNNTELISQLEVTLEEDTGTLNIMDVISKTLIEPEFIDSDNLVVLNKIIDALKSFYNSFVISLHNLRNIVNNLPDNNLFENTVNELFVTTVSPYAEIKITKDVFNENLAIFKNSLNTIAVLDGNLLRLIFKEYLYLNVTGTLFFTAHTIVDKITLNGTVGTDKKVN